uniref:Uncharacterized protein n=1 Tax=viral metagenome TaxID=1070528 RepID=A0A6C0CRJ1_9ZZZZ
MARLLNQREWILFFLMYYLALMVEYMEKETKRDNNKSKLKALELINSLSGC